MENLSLYRDRINTLDEQLIRLLNERANVALEVGKTKTSMGKAMYDPGRERAVLDHIVQLNQGPLSKGAVEEVFATIMTVCRELQQHALINE